LRGGFAGRTVQSQYDYHQGLCPPFVAAVAGGVFRVTFDASGAGVCVFGSERSGAHFYVCYGVGDPGVLVCSGVERFADYPIRVASWWYARFEYDHSGDTVV